MDSQTSRGFTLVEVLMVLIIIGVLATMSLSTMGTSLEEARFNSTLSDMKTLRDAAVGNVNLEDSFGRRAHFGFFGDIGAIPATIGALTAIGAKAAWATDATSRISSGWNGPYLSSTNASKDYTKDAWDNAYTYTTTASGAKFVSKGADGAVGGTGYDADITVEIPDEMRLASVYGHFNLAGKPFTATNFDVRIWYPNGGTGAITSTLLTVVPASKGLFQFSNIPMGVRSVQIFWPSEGAAAATIGPIVFTLDSQNYVVSSVLTDIDPP